MTAVFVIAAVVFFNVGMFAGMFLAYVATARNSFDVYEVTNGEGFTYYLVDPYEVEAALHVDGMLAVKRLRVLT